MGLDYQVKSTASKMSVLPRAASGSSQGVKWMIRQLKESWSIYDVKKLLYDVYIREMGWRFAKDNPTGFKIEESPMGQKILTDNLDSHSSWFGAYHEGNLVAVLRLVYRDTLGHLDMTRYESSRKPSLVSILDQDLNPNLLELQRCAVHSSYRKTNVFPHILLHTINHAIEQGHSVIGTTSVPRLATFFQHYCKVNIVEKEFLYTENHHGPSTVFYATHNDLINVRKLLHKILSHSYRTQLARQHKTLPFAGKQTSK